MSTQAVFLALTALVPLVFAIAGVLNIDWGRRGGL